MTAMVSVVDEKGYAATTVADVITRAGVSRATFYELFSHKEECFLATYEVLVSELLEFVHSAYDRPGEWPHRIRAALTAFLGALSHRPAAARVALVESIAAGPAAVEIYRRAVHEFLPAFDDGRKLTEHGDEIPPAVSRVVVGGVNQIIFDQIVAGHAEDLLDQLPEVLYVALAPYLGHEAALESMHRATRRRTRSDSGRAR